MRVALCTLCSLLALTQGVVEPPPQANNIVLVIADAWRYSAFSGAEKPDSLSVTPRLDAFRRESVDFSRAYSAYPLCTPSRISIQSGLYPSRHNVTKNGAPLSTSAPTIAETLSSLGFDTAYFGKWHVGGDGYGSAMAMKMVSEPHRHGFGYWEQGVSQSGPGFGDYRHPMLLSPSGTRSAPAGTWEPEFYTDRFLAWLRKHTAEPERGGGVGGGSTTAGKKTKPFFAMLSWRPPHGPWGFEPKEASKRVMEAYAKQLAEGGDLKLRANMPKRRWENPQGKDGLLSMMKGYYAATNELDGQFGRVLDAVKLLPEAVRDATVVVFCSDHGEMLESHELTGKGHWYDESARVPLMLRLPPALLRAQTSVAGSGGSETGQSNRMMDPLGSDRRRQLQGRSSSISPSSSPRGGRVYRHAASLTDLYPTLVSLATRGGLASPNDQSSATLSYLTTRTHIVDFAPRTPAAGAGAGAGAGAAAVASASAPFSRVALLKGSKVDGLDLAADVVACARAALGDPSCGGGGGSGLLLALVKGGAGEEEDVVGSAAGVVGGGRGGGGGGKKSGGERNVGKYKWSKPVNGRGGGHARRGAGGGTGMIGVIDDDDKGVMVPVRNETTASTFRTTVVTYRYESVASNLLFRNKSLLAPQRQRQRQRLQRLRQRRRRLAGGARSSSSSSSSRGGGGRALSAARVVFSGMPGFWRMATTGVLKVVVTGKACDCAAERLLLDLEADPFEMRPHKYTQRSAEAGHEAASAWYSEEAKRVEAALFSWCRTDRADGGDPGVRNAKQPSSARLSSGCGGGGGGGGGGGSRIASESKASSKLLRDQTPDASEEPAAHSSKHADEVGGGRNRHHRKPSLLGAGIVKIEKAVLHGLPEGTKGRTGRPPAKGPTVVFESTGNEGEAQSRIGQLASKSAHHHHLRLKDEHGGTPQSKSTGTAAGKHKRPGSKGDAGAQQEQVVPWWKKQLENKKAGST